MQLKRLGHRTGLATALGIALWGCDDAAPPAAIGPAVGTVAAPIVNGTRAGHLLFAEVGVLITTDGQGRELYACTATRFAPDLVLTAAHCLQPPPPGQVRQTWFSTAADAHRIAQHQPSRVIHTFAHPDYKPGGPLAAPLAWRAAHNADEAAALAKLHACCGHHAGLEDPSYWRCVFGLDAAFLRRLELVDGPVNAADIGVAVLDDADVAAPRALLPTAGMVPVGVGDTHLAVGYGIHDENVPRGATQVRHYAPIEVQGVGTYELQLSHAEAQVCTGDSGGPLLAPQAAGYVIVGIASRGLVNGAGVGSGPVIYARIRAFTPWIRATARMACREHVRSAQMCRDYPL